jgi:hypothetical protein
MKGNYFLFQTSASVNALARTAVRSGSQATLKSAARQLASELHMAAIASTILGVGLCSAASFPEASTQALLRLIGHGNHSSPAALGVGGRDSNSLVVPGDLHQQAPNQRVACPGDAPASVFLPRSVPRRIGRR